jgi:Bacterial Ig domain
MKKHLLFLSSNVSFASKNNRKESNFLLTTLLLVFSVGLSIGYGQYVHPNQAGRKGGDTSPGTGNQVVTSTYFGNAGNVVAQGVIMSVNKDGSNAASFHDFDGYPGDGSYPWYTTPHQGSNGKLYGATYIGGTSNWGTVYDYDFATCSQNVIYNSGPGPSGGSPANFANVNELSDGMIYSVQTFGGTQGGGRLFRMNKDGSGVQTLHDFHESNAVNYTPAANNTTISGGQQVVGPYAGKDGMWPYGFVVEGPDGKIYGTTQDGGSYSWGAIYRCEKDGSNYQVIYSGDPTIRAAYYKKPDGTVLTAFTESMQWLHGNVAFDQAGKLYVNGYYGGYLDLGGTAKMDADGGNYLSVFNSQSAADGYNCYRGPLVIDNTVYSTFRYGGGGVASIGVVWKVNTDGTNFTKLKTFEIVSGAYVDGTEPWAGLAYDGTNLFGSCIASGGVGSIGTIFKIKPDGTGYQTIHRFSNTAATPSCGAGKAGMFTYYPSAERVTFANVKLNCSTTCVMNAAACTAGSTPPTILSTSIANNCPATTVNLTSLVSASNVSWHTGTPATIANRVATPSNAGPGTYYAAIYDETNDCFSTATSAVVTATVNYACSNKITFSAPPGSAGTGSFTTPINTAKTGNVVTDLSPAGGAKPYVYSTVLCADGTASTATSKGGTIAVNASTGAYTYTPATGYIGIDTFCIKICDSTSPVPNCSTATYTITVTPKACLAVGSTPN